MKKAICYALFGYGRERQANCFDFHAYIRGLLLSIRMNRILFPEFDTIVEMDEPTYMGHQGLFDGLKNCGLVIQINGQEPLTKAMLWRLKPVFDYNNYSHVLCRDLDSPPTYREAQCVQEWLNSDLAAHAITDSVSHGIPMLGGLIGFHTGYWPVRTGYQHWSEMFNDVKIDFSQKGADQTFLNQYIYPKFANPNENPSIMQHYLLGMPNTFLPGYRNSIPNIEPQGVPAEMIISNHTCSHMGQAGWLMPPTTKFLVQHKDRFTDIYEVEKKYPDVAYWVNDKTFE